MSLSFSPLPAVLPGRGVRWGGRHSPCHFNGVNVFLSSLSRPGLRGVARISSRNAVMCAGASGAAEEAPNIRIVDTPPTTDNELEEASPQIENTAGEDDAWFSVDDTELVAAEFERKKNRPSPGESGTVLDLGELDEVGRDAMSAHGYTRVINVDVDKGGALEDDEDNNDLLSGVGFDTVLDDERLVDVLSERFGFETMSHVQLAAVPRIANGSDLMIMSYTGTGKTLAFLIPIVEAVDVEQQAVQAVVVAPTRELAMQIFRECEKLCEGSDILTQALIGGANPLRQVERLRTRQPHIVVGTPGRLAELEGNRVLKLRKVRTIVVDEVDESMQDSFREHLENVFKACPKDRQIVFASATGDNDAVRMYAQEWMREPELLRVLGKRRIPSNITHWCTVVPARLRIDILRRLMTAKDPPKQAICFVDDPRRVDIVCERLFSMKLAAGALRGNAHKLERAEVLRLFRKGAVPLLVTTEVAARGLDIPEVSHVFNLDLPTDADHYIHRAGRTGRARANGCVVNIATAETAFVISRFEKELDITITRMEPRGGVYAPPLDRERRAKPRKSPGKPPSDTRSNPESSRPHAQRDPRAQVRERASRRSVEENISSTPPENFGTPARRKRGEPYGKANDERSSATEDPLQQWETSPVQKRKPGKFSKQGSILSSSHIDRNDARRGQRRSESRVSRGSSLGPSERTGGAGKQLSRKGGGALRGAELRIANKDNKFAREMRERDGVRGVKNDTSREEKAYPNSTSGDNSDDGDKEDAGFEIDGDVPKKKKKTGGRKRRSVSQRAREDKWVGNRGS